MANTINRAEFRINGIIDPYRTVLENLDDLFTCAGAWLSNDVTTGKWSVIINQPTEPTWFFDDRNIVGSVAVSSTGIKEYYNRVNVEFESPQWPGVKDNVVVEIPPEQRNPNEFENTLEMSLPLVNSAPLARILGEMELKQTRVDFIIQFQTDWNYAGIKPGEVFTITNPAMGFVDKKFRCITVEEADDEEGLLYTITGLEYDELVYERGGLFRPNRERAEDPLKYNNEVIRLIDDEETARRTIVGLPDGGIPGAKINVPDLIDQPGFDIITGDLSDLIDDLADLNENILPGLQDSLDTLNGRFPITEVDISDDAISAPKIQANSIDSLKIVTAGLDAAVIRFGQMSGDRILANTIGAAQINALELFAQDIGVTGKIRVESPSHRLELSGLEDDFPFWFGSGTKNEDNAKIYFTEDGDAVFSGTLRAAGGSIAPGTRAGGSSILSGGAIIYGIKDGDTVEFPVEFEPEEVPRIRILFLDGGITYSPSLSGAQTQLKEAVDITTTSFKAVLKLREADTGGAATPVSINFSGGIATKTSATNANDNRYRVNFSATVQNGPGEPGIINVVFQAKRAVDTTWITLAQRQYTSTFNAPATFTNQTLVGTLLDADANCEFRIQTEVINISGSATASTISYLEAASLGEVTLTPGSETVSALILLSDD